MSVRARSKYAREELAGLLWVALLGRRRKADEVGEEHGDEPAFGRRRLAWSDRCRCLRGESVPHSAQKRWPGACGAPQDGHASASAVPHSTQNFAPGWFSVVHDGQIIGASLTPLDALV